MTGAAATALADGAAVGALVEAATGGRVTLVSAPAGALGTGVAGVGVATFFLPFLRLSRLVKLA